MAYKVHNFAVGSALPARQLNEMDAQIALNAEGVAAFNRQMVVEEMAKLSLTTDGQYVMLQHDGVEVAAVAIADVSQVVPATEMTVTSGSAIALDAGAEAAITAAVQPADSTQTVRFRSGDVSVATVTSQGVVTGVGAGITDIDVMCGSHSDTVTATISEIATPTWVANAAIYLDDNTRDKYDSPAAKLDVEGSHLAAVFGFGAEDGVFLRAGQKLTVTYSGGNNYYFRYAYAIAPVDAEGFTESIDWSNRPCIANCRMVANIFGDTASHAAPITYTATEDCHVIFCFNDGKSYGSGAYTDEELAALNDVITIRISPAA